MMVNALCNNNPLKPGLKNRIFDCLDNSAMTGDRGADNILEFLEGELGQDKLYNMAEAWIKINIFRREGSQKIGEYVFEFEVRWKLAENAGIGKISNKCEALIILSSKEIMWRGKRMQRSFTRWCANI